MDIFAPIQLFADTFTYQWLYFAKGSYAGDTINFFLYDVIKIGLLLVIINYLMAITRYYFSVEKARAILAKHRWYGSQYLFAALLGVVTPFCSCSSIPLFIGFLSAGIPLGVTFTFLISSPLINESSLYLFPAIFGLKVTLLYNIVGITIAILGGMVIQRLNMKKYVRPEFLKFTSKTQFETKYEGQKVPKKDLFMHWNNEAMTLTKKVFPYVLLGVGVGALIHGFIPQSLLTHYLSAKQWWTVPLAVLLGTPLYANSVGVIPIIEAFIGKGVPMGTALAFMTATVTISLPEGLMLAKVMRPQLLLTFFSITILGVLCMGYFFNWLL
jgi:uncharacterized protein